MKQTFEYYFVEQPMDTLEIPTVGCVCIKAMNDFGDTWYLQIHTNLGNTQVVEHGPYSEVENPLSTSYNYNYTKMAYDEKRICNRITKFLQDARRDITSAEIVYDEEANKSVGGKYDEFYKHTDSTGC